MTDPPTAGAAHRGPGSDLLEQRATIDWPELPEDEVTAVPPGWSPTGWPPKAIYSSRHRQQAGADDDRPHDPPALRE